MDLEATLRSDLLKLEEQAKQVSDPTAQIDKIHDEVLEKLRQKCEELKRTVAQSSSRNELLRQIKDLNNTLDTSSELTDQRRVFKRISEIKEELLFTPQAPVITFSHVINAISSLGTSDSTSKHYKEPAPKLYTEPIPQAPSQFTRPPDPPRVADYRERHSSRHSETSSYTSYRAEPKLPDRKELIQDPRVPGGFPTETRSRTASSSSTRPITKQSSADKGLLSPGFFQSVASKPTPPLRSDPELQRLDLKNNNIVSAAFQKSEVVTEGQHGRSYSGENAAYQQLRSRLPPNNVVSSNYLDRTLTESSQQAPRKPSPIIPRSPTPEYNRSSTPQINSPPFIQSQQLESSFSQSKTKIHYFNPITKDVEVIDKSLTPETPARVAQEIPAQLRPAQVRSAQERPAQERPARFAAERSATDRFASARPHNLNKKDDTVKCPLIEDLCLNKSIKRYFTINTEFTNSKMKNFVTIEELYSPSQFFVKSSKAEKDRDMIQIEVAEYVATLQTKIDQIMVQKKSHVNGALVLAKFEVDGVWYRASIVEQVQQGFYEHLVLFLDYGNRSKVSYRDMIEMPHHLRTYPMSVQQCYLANIAPPNGDAEWDPDTAKAMFDMIDRKDLEIKVIDILHGVYGVVLNVAVGREFFNLNEKLIEMDLASKYHNQGKPVEGEKSGQTNKLLEICTSPTKFSPSTTFDLSYSDTEQRSSQKHEGRHPGFESSRVPRQRSPSLERRTHSTIAASPPSRRRQSPPRQRTPPRHRAQSPARSERSRTSRRARSPRRDESHGYSSDDEEPSVGRPPSFGNTVTPRNSFNSFGNGGSPKSKTSGFEFGNAKGMGRGNLKNVSEQGGNGNGLQQETSNHDDKWKHDKFYEVQAGLPSPKRAQTPESNPLPPNFPVSYTDLVQHATKSSDIKDMAQQISQDTLVAGSSDKPPRRKLKAKSPSKKTFSDAKSSTSSLTDTKSQSVTSASESRSRTPTPPSEFFKTPAGFEATPPPVGFEAAPTPSGFEAAPTPAGFEAAPTPAGFSRVVTPPGFSRTDTGTPIVYTTDTPTDSTRPTTPPDQRIPTPRHTTPSRATDEQESGSSVLVLNADNKSPRVDESGDDIDELEIDEVVLSFHHGVDPKQRYNPKTYNVDDLTEEDVYKLYKKETVKKLNIEEIPSQNDTIPVFVSSVESPEFFCVSLLTTNNLAALQAVSNGLNKLYLPPKIEWQVTDKCIRQKDGIQWIGEIMNVNKNLLQIKWEGSTSETLEWVNGTLVDRYTTDFSKIITKKLTSSACKTEFDVGDFCAALYSDKVSGEKSWYRAMVLVVRRTSKKKIFKYEVFFVDYGNIHSCDTKSVRPLPPHYLALPAQAIPCNTPEIQPRGNKTQYSESSSSSLEEVDEEFDEPVIGCYGRDAALSFENLVINERVYISVRCDLIPLHYGYLHDIKPDPSNPLVAFRNDVVAVSLADRVPGSNELFDLLDEYIANGHAERLIRYALSNASDFNPVAEQTLQDKFARMEAAFDNLEGARESPLTVPQLNSEISSDFDSESFTLSSFDPMSDDYNSASNLVDHDRDDISQAIYGEKLSRRTLCRFFSRGRRCFKGNECRYLHQKKTDFHSEQNEQAMVVENKPPTPTNDMPVIASVTSALSPFHFWAQILPQNLNPAEMSMNREIQDPLTELTKKMTSVYRFRGFREAKYYPALGEIVAVHSKQHDGKFLRSRVTETDEVGDRMCKVFHLDFGTFEVVPEQSLRIMDPVFIKELPFQAQEMFLADIKPAYRTDSEPIFIGDKQIDNNQKEAEEAKKFFLDLVLDKWLIAKVIEKTAEGALCVHIWDCSEDNWKSINKELVDRGHADSLHPLPEQLTTDCGTLAASSYQFESA